LLLQVIVAARVEHKRLIKKKVGLESREKYRAAFQNYEDNERGDVEALHELADSLRDKINHSMMELEVSSPIEHESAHSTRWAHFAVPLNTPSVFLRHRLCAPAVDRRRSRRFVRCSPWQQLLSYTAGLP